LAYYKAITRPSVNLIDQLCTIILTRMGSHKLDVVSLALQPSAGYGPLVPRGFLITHSDASQSVGLLWTSDQLIA
jgi:hypothetical protein